MKKPFYFGLLVACFVLFPVLVASGGMAESSQLEVSVKLKSKKISIVRFFPLPGKVIGKRHPHDRVFTGEYYSKTPQKLKDVEGIFIPKDYLEIIGNNFNVFRIQYGLDIKWTDSFAEVESDSDLVMMGSVLDFSANSSKATVKMAIRILDGKTLRVIKDTVITKSIERKSKKSMSFNLPFHTLGSLGSDFYLERYLLNLACYQSIQDLISIVQKNVR